MTMVLIMAMITMMLMATITHLLPPIPTPKSFSPQPATLALGYLLWVSWVLMVSFEVRKLWGVAMGAWLSHWGFLKKKKENRGLNIESKSFSVIF